MPQSLTNSVESPLIESAVISTRQMMTCRTKIERNCLLKINGVPFVGGKLDTSRNVTFQQIDIMDEDDNREDTVLRVEWEAGYATNS